MFVADGRVQWSQLRLSAVCRCLRLSCASWRSSLLGACWRLRLCNADAQQHRCVIWLVTPAASCSLLWQWYFALTPYCACLVVMLERLGNRPHGNQEALMVNTRMEDPQVSLGEQVPHLLPSLLLYLWSGDRKDVRSVNSWVLVCWWWRFDGSYGHFIAPVVATTSIVLSSNKSRMRYSVIGFPGLSWKRAIKWVKRVIVVVLDESNFRSDPPVAH